MSAVVVTAGFPDGTELTAHRDGVRYILRADHPGAGFHLNLTHAEAVRLRDQLTQALEEDS